MPDPGRVSQGGTMRNRLRWIIAIFMVFALVAAACGDDDDTSANGDQTSDDSGSDDSGSDDSGSDDSGSDDGGSDDSGSDDSGTDDSGTDDSGADDGAADEPVTVALLLAFAANDLSWNQRALEGAQALEASGRIQLIAQENVGLEADGFIRAAEGVIGDGADLVIGHGFDYMDAILQTLGPDNPEVAFAWAGGIGGTSDNVADYDQPFYEGSYLAGILAAGVTESGVIGSLSGQDVPVCHAMHAAFLAGAQSVDASITLQTAASGDWNDVALNKEAILAQAEQGADVFSTCGQGPALGAIEAAEENGLSVVGYVGDMSVVNSEVVLTSVVWNTDVVWEAMVSDIEAGTFSPGQLYRHGVASGAVEVTLNPGYAGEVSDDVVAAFDDAVAALNAGTLEVPYDGGF